MASKREALCGAQFTTYTDRETGETRMKMKCRRCQSSATTTVSQPSGKPYPVGHIATGEAASITLDVVGCPIFTQKVPEKLERKHD